MHDEIPRLLSNSDAIRLFRELNVKHRNNEDHIHRTIMQSEAIYERVDKHTMDPEVINALLSLWWQYRNSSQIVTIWKDIELFHSSTISNASQRALLSYSSLMKSLLVHNDTATIDVTKCMQCLEWMEQSRYRLSIHDAFLNKLVSRCGALQHINALRYIHKLMDRNLIGHGPRTNLSHYTALIVSYGLCGREYLSDALSLFHSIPDSSKDAVIIGAMMKVLVDHGQYGAAMEMYHDLSSSLRNHVIHGIALRSCMKSNDWGMAQRIMSDIPDADKRGNVRMSTVVMEVFGHFGDCNAAMQVFESVDEEKMNAICIGSMMKILMENDREMEALDIYHRFLERSNTVTHSLAIRCCKKRGDLQGFESGKRIHHELSLEEMRDLRLAAVLIDFYGNFADIESAEKVFAAIPTQNVDIGLVDSMMTAYINNGGNKQALFLYDAHKSIHDNIAHVLALKATINANDVDKGLQIHATLSNDAVEKDVHLQTVLIDFYGTFGHIQSAADIFYSIPMDSKSIIAVNAMMTAYIHCNLHHEAINLYEKLNTTYSYLIPDIATYRTILKACCNPILAEYGKRLHSEWITEKQKLQKVNHFEVLNDPEITLHLITMYAACGSTADCEQVFRSFTTRIRSGFSPSIKVQMAMNRAMLSCYANIGDLEKAMKFWEEMKDGLMAMQCLNDPGVFVAIFHCCSISGDLQKAKEIWNAIGDDDEVKYDEFVMSAFVDCLAKNGTLEETIHFMTENEYRYPSGWLSLMSSCRHSGEVLVGERVYERIMEIFGDDARTMSAASLLMSHLFASKGEFERQKEIREEMVRKGWTRQKGTAEVYVNGKVVEFQSGAGIDNIYYHNDDEAMYREIDAKLEELYEEMSKEHGFHHDYLMLTRQCEGEDVKDRELRRHAEKQALAYALLKTESGTEIVIKNAMRICNDCKEFMRLASLVTKRKITIVDPNQIHFFEPQ